MFVQTEIGKTPNQLRRYTRERHEELAQRYGFQTFRPADQAMVDRYSAESIFFDLSFTNFWAWDLIFHYRWRMVGDTLTMERLRLSGAGFRESGGRRKQEQAPGAEAL